GPPRHRPLAPERRRRPLRRGRRAREREGGGGSFEEYSARGDGLAEGCILRRMEKRAFQDLVDLVARLRAPGGCPWAREQTLEAHSLTDRASRVGFDWPSVEPVIEKLNEELGELRHEIDADEPDRARVEDEVGDLLFAAVNVARKLGVDPETALKRTNRKFRR